MKLHTVVICTIHVIFLGNEFCIDIISGYVEFKIFYPNSMSRIHTAIQNIKSNAYDYISTAVPGVLVHHFCNVLATCILLVFKIKRYFYITSLYIYMFSADVVNGLIKYVNLHMINIVSLILYLLVHLDKI